MDKIDSFLYKPIGRKKFIIFIVANYTLYTVVCMFLCYTDIITGGKELVEHCSLPEFIFNIFFASLMFSLWFSSYGNVPEVPFEDSFELGCLFCISQILIVQWRRYDGNFRLRLEALALLPVIGIFFILYLAIKKRRVEIDFHKKLDRISYISYSIVVYLLFSLFCLKLFSDDFSESTMSFAQNYGLPGIFVYVLGTSIPFFLWQASDSGVPIEQSVGYGIVFFLLLILFVYQRCNYGKFNKVWCVAPLYPILNLIVLFWLTYKKGDPPEEETFDYGDPDSYERTYSNNDSDKKN